MHFKHSTFFSGQCKHQAECVIATEQGESFCTLILCLTATGKKVSNAASDNLYCSKNERWCSLHCLQYNAMYQTAEGYEVCNASPSRQITYWFANGSIATAIFEFGCRYETKLNLITATNGCRCGPNLPAAICFHYRMLYLEHDFVPNMWFNQISTWMTLAAIQHELWGDKK